MSFNFEEFPILETQRLALVPLEDAHKGDLFRLFTLREVTAYFPVIPITAENDLLTMISYFKQQFSDRSGIRWGIAIKGQQNIIGTIGFSTISAQHKGSIVYALLPDHQRKGIITEALDAVLQFGFTNLQLRRIEAEVMPGNTASEQLLEKTGFSYEGLLQQWMCWHGQYTDIKMYSLLRNKNFILAADNPL